MEALNLDNLEDNIWFCGDLHGVYKPLINLVQAYRPAAIVLLGDNMGGTSSTKFLSEELEAILPITSIHWIYGNHDTDHESTVHLLFKDPVLKDNNIHGKFVDVLGVKIAGLGGTFRGKNWNPKPGDGNGVLFNNYEEYLAAAELKRPIRLRKKEPNLEAKMHNEDRHALSAIYVDDYNALADIQADVLVTHEAPSCHPYGFAEIDLLAQYMGVKKSFHGHHHDDLDYSSHQVPFIPRGVGLRGITTLSGKIVRKGDIDDIRLARGGMKDWGHERNY